MFKKILIALLVVIGIFVVVVALQPSEFTITRSASIAAPPAEVWGQVNDFRKWAAWSPWDKMDPAMTRTYSEPSFGLGATYAWSGNKDVGVGSMEITETEAGQLIRIRLEFLEPMAGASQTEFLFQPDNGGTNVTWSMTGKNNFISKAVCMFMDMQKMLGGQFEAGLASLKAVSEEAATQAEPLDPIPADTTAIETTDTAV